MAKDSGFPSKEALADFVARAGGVVARRDIARHFDLKGEERKRLRETLAEMAADGMIESGAAKRVKSVMTETLPPVTVIDVASVDENGDLLCTPVQWRAEAPAPKIVLGHRAANAEKPAVGVGDRLLARLTERDGVHHARVLKRLGRGGAKMLAVFRKNRGGGIAEPVDKKARHSLVIERGDEAGAEDGDLVWVETKNQRGYGPRRARVREVAGAFDDEASFSLIALANHGVPQGFTPEEEREAEEARLPDLQGREDLRALPLLTIDPADAKDHDDAVCAVRDEDPANEGGFRVWVAIADVAAFVRPGSALDRGARTRGNSVYLPDRVVPMLPERLSNGLCSLVDGEDRPCMAVEMTIDAGGRKRRHRFVRGMMRSVATLSYEEAQATADDTRDGGELKPVIDDLWAAYSAMSKAREERAPLDLDMPERKIVLEKGRVAGVALRERFDAHRLIEEMMIQANVCAAETCEEKRVPVIYRIHDAPDPEKLAALSDYLESLGYSFAKGQVVRPKTLNQLLDTAKQRDESELVGDVVLRTQSQAVYAVDNIGHFGLNLQRYAHFTSPIRRYADLTVHRALVKAGKLGQDGQTKDEAASLAETAKDISDYERRAMAAERETVDRFLASFLEAQVGGEFRGRIAGVTRAGLFVKLDETGADGFCPARHLGWEYFRHDEARRCLVGDSTGKVFRLGQRVEVKLLEAAPVTGGLLLEMLSEPEDAPPDVKRTPKDPKKAGRAAARKGPPRKGGAKPGGKRKAGKRAGKRPGGKRPR